MDKNEFVALMTQLAIGIKKYAPDFTDRLVLQTWYADLSDIPSDRLRDACQYARRNLDEFPSIAWLIRKCKGSTLSDSETGQDIASRIESAISRFGYINHQMAREYIGDLGWEVVRQCGGWIKVCDIDSMDLMPSYRKHWRDIGTIVSKNYHGKGMNTAPRIPESDFNASNFLQLVSQNDRK